jgi:hypothetical protein
MAGGIATAGNIYSDAAHIAADAGNVVLCCCMQRGKQ